MSGDIETFSYNTSVSAFMICINELTALKCRNRQILEPIVVLLAPFVEEVLFRGLVFGCLREKSRIFAYILSCALFAFLHVWTAAVSNWDLGYLILMLQYLVPGLVFAWAYEHSGTLWTSILLHMLVNALSLFTIAS